MTYAVIVDPGAVRWGIALFSDEGPGGDQTGLANWYCTWVAVLDKWQAIDWLGDHLACFDVDHLVYERWALRVDKAKAVAGDDPECGTAESVGVIKYLVRIRNRQADDAGERNIELHSVAPAAKMTASSACHVMGIKSVAKQLRNAEGGSTHDTLAAELIGWAWLFQTGRAKVQLDNAT